MEIGIMGAGESTYRLALSIKSANTDVILLDLSSKDTDPKVKEALRVVYELPKFTQEFKARRILWLVLPNSNSVTNIIEHTVPFLDRGDIIIDNAKADIEDITLRYDLLKEIGVDYVHISMMDGLARVGGDEDITNFLEKIFINAYGEKGYNLSGPIGSDKYINSITDK